MEKKKQETIRYDAATRAWFDKFPIMERAYVETTVTRCETCGLYYKAELGHKCRGKTATAERSEYIRQQLSKPYPRPSCVDCAYCSRGKYQSGKWYCNNPEVHVGVPVNSDLPCFVRRGSKEAHDRGL